MSAPASKKASANPEDKNTNQAMTSQEAVDALNNLPGDPESAHGQADDIIMEFLASNGMGSVSDAFEKARARIGFWYA